MTTTHRITTGIVAALALATSAAPASAGQFDLNAHGSYVPAGAASMQAHSPATIPSPPTSPLTIVRVTPHQKRRWFHRWQHLYLFALYGITASRWHLYGDFKEVATGYMGPHRIARPRGR